MSLMLHCGGATSSWKDVCDTPVPENTATHYPVRHREFVDIVRTQLGESGVEIKEEVHALNKAGSHYFGLMKLGGEDDTDKGYSTIVGLRNSHNKTFSAGFVMGSQVFVCDNLCMSGEVKIQRKHTVNILRDLPGLVSQGIGELGCKKVEQDTRISYYKEYCLDKVNVNDWLVRGAVDNKIFPTASIPKILKEYREPQHKEFLGDDGEHTAWTLMNAVTEVRKGVNVFGLPKQQNRMVGMLDALVGRPEHKDWNFQYEEDAVLV